MTAVREPGPINDNTYYRQWMELFAENYDSIDAISFLADLMWKRVYKHISEDLKPLLLPPLEDAVELAARTYKANQP